MGLHHTMVNKTKKEYFDMGKFIFMESGNNFQIENEKLQNYLFDTRGDDISIEHEDFEKDGYTRKPQAEIIR